MITQLKLYRYNSDLPAGANVESPARALGLYRPGSCRQPWSRTQESEKTCDHDIGRTRPVRVDQFSRKIFSIWPLTYLTKKVRYRQKNILHVLPPEKIDKPVAPQSPPSWLWGFSRYAEGPARIGPFQLRTLMDSRAALTVLLT